MKLLLRLIVTCCVLTVLAGCNKQSSSGGSSTPIKIGFVVKQPEEPWFQNEWKYADKAAAEKGFTLVKIGAGDGEKALAAIDNLSAQGAQGLIICTPDVKLGPALVAKAKADDLKIMSVDDQFLSADGKPMADVHHLGISAHNIGLKVGKTLFEQMTARGWTASDTALCAITFDELETARQRTEGAIEALVAAGFPKDRIFKGAEQKAELASAIDAANIVLTQHPDVKHWLICSTNDTGVLGAVRATEGRGLGADSVCGIGINGTDAVSEFQKASPTGLYGSILLSARKHGYDTTMMMYDWIKDGKEPPLATYTEGVLITRDTYQKIMQDQ